MGIALLIAVFAFGVFAVRGSVASARKAYLLEFACMLRQWDDRRITPVMPIEAWRTAMDEMDRAHTWRLNRIHSVSWNQAVFSFWRPVESFYPHTAELRRAGK